MAADGVARDAPSADDVAAATVRVGEPRLVDGLVHWLRSAPDGSGDMLLVRESPAGPQRCSAPGRSLRSALYGYGASAWAPTAAGPVGIEARTRALVRVGTERHEPLCAPREGAALGDPVELPGTDWVLAVEADATTCRLIAVSVVDGRRVEVLEVDGRAAEPQPSPDGRTLAWLRWPRRRMPWDAAEVWVGTLDVGRDGVALRRRRRLDGGEGASAGQPTWRGDGALAYVTEAAGHWQPYVCDDGGAVLLVPCL